MTEKKIPKEARSELLARARKMRSEPTEAEVRLWRAIRLRQLGEVKFRRQHLFGAYIVDFYCPQAKLVIEVDGPVHQSQQEYDQTRSDELISRGYKVFRLKNEAIMEDLDAVLDQIRKQLQR